MEPTSAAYGELRLAYEKFNQRLFGGELPHCLLTLQREKRTYGYFSSKRFGNRKGDTTDEIALNPEYFAVVPLLETLQTIAHEMVHLWQAHFGKPGRGRYHNAEWGDKMEAIGLMPSSTGKPGGRRVGDAMADYVIPGGRFAAAAAELLQREDFGITWYDRFTPAHALYSPADPTELPELGAHAFEVAAANGVAVVPKLPGPRVDRSNRVKYTCPGCGLNVWGKPSIRVGCMDCALELAAADDQG
jgi:predicted SprT family Zn-dependent metalloprotease/ribosomal protein S27E